jgi:MFS family permease
LTGALLVLAGLTGVVALFPTYLVVGGQEVSQAGGVGSVLLGLVTPLVSAAVGGGLAAGRLPRFGLAYAGVAGALAVGLLLIELYRAQESTIRPGVEVIAGQQVLTSSVDISAGWVLGVVSLGLTVLAGALAAAAWGRTVMDDSGLLDPARPGLAALAVLLGVGTVLCLVLPPADVPDRLVTDPATGLQTVVEQDGPQGLLERPGLALLGGLLLAGAVVLCSVLAPSLRPRLAAVGGLLAITAVVLTAGLAGLRDAAVSEDLEWTLPGVGLVVAGLGYGVLTVLAWRLRRSAAPARRP